MTERRGLPANDEGLENQLKAALGVHNVVDITWTGSYDKKAQTTRVCLNCLCLAHNGETELRYVPFTSVRTSPWPKRAEDPCVGEVRITDKDWQNDFIRKVREVREDRKRPTGRD